MPSRKCPYCGQACQTFKSYVAHYDDKHRKVPAGKTHWAKFRKPGKKRRR